MVRLQPGTQTVVPSGDYARFQVTPKGDDKKKSGVPVDASGLVITLENLKISSRPGTARIEIREVATTNTDQWSDNPRFTKLALTKFPAPKIPAVVVSDFTANSLEVEAGTEITLTWNGPSTLDYTVSHGGDPHPVKNDHACKATIDRDTTFQLSYVTGGTTHYLTTTVTVKNPKLTGLEVDGPLTVTGDTGVQKLTVAKDLTAQGALTGGDSTVKFGEGIQVSGSISASGGISTSGGLSASGAIAASGVTVGGNSVFVNGDVVNLWNDATGGAMYTSTDQHCDAYYVFTETGGHDRSKWYLKHG